MFGVGEDRLLKPAVNLILGFLLCNWKSVCPNRSPLSSGGKGSLIRCVRSQYEFAKLLLPAF